MTSLRTVFLATITLASVANAQEAKLGFLDSDMYCKDVYLELKSKLDDGVEKPEAFRDSLILKINQMASSCQNQHERNLMVNQKVQEDKVAAAKFAALPGARIGMTAATVVNKTNWGKPDSVNRTITGNSIHEQWVYGSGNYLYFVNGRLTTIQN